MQLIKNYIKEHIGLDWTIATVSDNKLNQLPVYLKYEYEFYLINTENKDFYLANLHAADAGLMTGSY